MSQTDFDFLSWPVTDSDLAPGQFVFQFAFKDGPNKPNDFSPNANEATKPVLELGGPKGQGNSKYTSLEQRRSFSLLNWTEYAGNALAEVLKLNGVSVLGSQTVSGQGNH